MNRKRKDKWIKALEETIEKYQTNLDNNTRPDNDIDKCPLCVSSCYNCIHFSSFGQGIHCTQQTSRRNVNPPKAFGATAANRARLTLIPKERTAIKYRQRYLKTIITKLQQN